MIAIIGEQNKRALEKIKKRGKINLAKVEQSVNKILKKVRKNGDLAVIKYTKKFDGVQLTAKTLKVTRAEIRKAYQELSIQQIRSLKLARKNIELFARRQLPLPFEFEIGNGIVLGEMVRPLDSVGIYVPAGRYPLPSSVLMNAVPAQVAGVRKIIACTPPDKSGKINPAILVACDMAGVKEIYKIGGAQAIGAMAYGTTTVPAVNKIVGPGNAYVTEAKKQVFGNTGIDFLAGPTEVMVIAEKGNPEWIAADLLAQAEHDVLASAILVTWNKKLAKEVQQEIEQQLKRLKTREVVEQSIRNAGAIILVKNKKNAFKIANDFAPEHLEIAGMKNSLKLVKNAGAVFLGEYSCEAFGDYCSGTNHVLPTTQVAKYRAGLSTRDFVKQIAWQKIGKNGAEKLAKIGIPIARMEFLDGHAKSMELRVQKGNAGR